MKTLFLRLLEQLILILHLLLFQWDFNQEGYEEDNDKNETNIKK